MTLFKRIVAENRAAIVALAIGVLANVAAYALVVRPLAEKSTGSVDRANAANAARVAAERDYAAARALVAGKTQAQQELATFYDKVIPADLAAARRLTYSMLPALARKANVKWTERHTTVDPVEKNSHLGHLHIDMVLEGDYENVRQFIYDLETAPEFVIIDDVTLTQGEAGKPLTLKLDLSTYYRLSPNGT